MGKKCTTETVLELKFKKGNISRKHLYKNEYIVKPEACHWSVFVKSNNPQVSKARLYNLIPISIVTYERKYYASCDDKIRLTIDTNLKSYLQHSSKHPNFRFC